ncbi:MAG: DUF4190 domain-containing protein [Planctomycetota bacterium]|jgi:hypothetical protein
MTQVPSPPPAGAALRPHRGAMILVFGILSIVLCFLFGVASWVMGNADLKAMAVGEMDPSGEGMTRAGKICGIVGVALAVMGICATIFWFVIAAMIVGGAAAAEGAGAAGG